MKKIFCILSAGLLVACADMDYDLSDGRLDKDLTLFGQEITVPVGSVGPITLGSLLFDTSIGKALASFVQEDTRDGSYTLQAESTLYSVNVYELERMAGEVEEPFTWSPGSVSGSVEGIATMLGFLGLSCVDQKLSIIGENPLTDLLPVQATVSVSCLDANYLPSYSASKEVSVLLFSGGGSYNSLYDATLPAEVTDVVSSVSLEDFSLDLPAHPVGQLDDPAESDVIEFKLKHSCGIGFGERFSISQTLPLENLGLQIGKYRLHRCEVTVALENTLPLSVTFRSVKVLKRDAEGDWVPDDNISVTPDVSIAGGSVASPAVTQLTLQFAAAEGTIPDIDALEIELEVKAAPGCTGVALSSRQGISVKSSSARIRGGITIPEN